jgi:hypothetical protein
MAYFQPFSNVNISIKTSRAAPKKYLQYGGDLLIPIINNNVIFGRPGDAIMMLKQS